MIKKMFYVLSLVILGATLVACGNKDQDLYEKVMSEGKLVVGTEGTYLEQKRPVVYIITASKQANL